jgi:acetylornithine deacetylase/succinyl-diaminopimelate desuccinylase-like protein
MALLEEAETRADMELILRDPPDPDAAARLSRTPSFNAVLRTTCVATRLDAGHADNALPQTARANVNCRILPGHSPEEVQRTLTEVVADAEVTVTIAGEDTSAPASPLRPEVMGAAERVTAEMWPGVPVIPTMASGATDSRFFRSAGVAAFGVSGIFAEAGDVRAHGRDERIGVKQFYEGYEFLRRFVGELAGVQVDSHRSPVAGHPSSD